MVRRHGWQLPAHTLQVAAMTVFFLLAVAYYIFLAPFLWFTATVITAYAVYSPLALAVTLLYIRCTAINPADTGVLAHQELMHPHKEENIEKNSADSSLGIDPPPSGFSLSLQPSAQSSAAASIRDVLAQKESPLEEGQVESVQRRRPKLCSFSGLCGFCCFWAVAPDNCWEASAPVQDEMLFCTLCNTEVPMYSKHCRSCDKCVDGFDHHCLWLNNCIGRKNYRTFVALMTTSLMLLIVEWLVGGAVFIRCFVDKQGIENQITDKLGNGFSIAPFATVVAVCTLVAMLACLPLGELFFFHLILIKKGITTYEYVMAVRAHDSGPSTDDDPSRNSSTSTSTVPGMSRSNSLGQQHGGWCTPPRIFVEHQDEVIPHPGSHTASSTGRPERPNPTQKGKPDVKISAWRLAKIGKEEARLAASKARKASSVLRPVGPAAQDLKGLTESEESYSSNSSRQSSVSVESGLPHSMLRRAGKEDIKGSMSLSPYKSELPRIKTGREPDIPISWSKRLRLDTKSSGSLSRTNFSTSLPSTQFNTPLRPDQLSRSTTSSAIITPVQDSNIPASSSQSQSAGPPVGSPAQIGRPDLTRTVGATTVSDGYDASGGETTDDMGRHAMKGKKIRAGTKFSPSDLKNPAFFKSRGASRYGGSAASRAIQFKGRGISTSVLSPYEGGPSNWRDPTMSSPSSGSDGGITATLADTGQLYPRLRIPSLTSSGAALRPLPKDSSIPRHSSGMQPSGQVSIFFSSPLMPIGESAAGRRHQSYRPDLPPKPPVIPRYSSLGTSFIRSSSSSQQVPHTQPLPPGSGAHSKELNSSSSSSLPRPGL